MESDTAANDETVVRQALKELSENIVVPSPTVNTNSNINKVGTRKSEKFDAVTGIIENSGGGRGDCNSRVVDSDKLENIDATKSNRRSSLEKQENKISNNKTDLSKLDDEISSSSDNYNSNLLPDIVKVQPTVISTATDTDDSLILALTSNLTGLNIGTPKGNREKQPQQSYPQSTLAVPNSSTIISDAISAVSSDDEVYSECQAYNEAHAMESGDLNHSIHWDNVVSSVTSGCADSLDNTLEQIEPSTTDLLPESSRQPEIDDSSEATPCDSHLSNNIPQLISNEYQNVNEITVDTTFKINSTQEQTEIPQIIENVNIEETQSIKNSSSDPVAILNGTYSEPNVSIPNSKIDPMSTSRLQSPIPEDLNGTFNANDGRINTEHVRPAQELNATFQTTPTVSPNTTIDMKSNSPINNTTFAATDKNLNGTFDATIETRVVDDYSSKIKGEKCHENETKALLANPNAPEPMDVDDMGPGGISPSLNSTRIVCKDLSPTKSNDFTQDSFVENFGANQMDVTFKAPNGPPPQGAKRKSFEQTGPIVDDSEFPSNGMILNPSDFDFLLSKGNNNVTVERSSLLLKFDPLVGQPVPVNQQQAQKQQSPPIQGNIRSINSTRNASHFETSLSPALEEEDSQTNNTFLHDPYASEVNTDCNRASLNSTVPVGGGSDACSVNLVSSLDANASGLEANVPSRQSPPNFHENQKLLKDRHNRRQPEEKRSNAKMSVDVIQDMKIEHETKSIDHINSQTDEKLDYKMAELEKKMKNETLKTEDVEKKLKEAEQREEALLKRIAEKDRTISKMSGVLEAYEKAIAELIAEKEQIIQNYEKQLSEIKADRDLNYQHLTSLEATFSDLHAKYERSKQVAATLKGNEEVLLAEKKQNLENLRLQEQRYDKMKNHAMQQLEIANNKLETLTKNHGGETTKLKALLKKEEISRLSVTEQLLQKSRENEELVKICDELINGQGSS